MGYKGISVRQTGDRIIFRESLKDSAGVAITTGTTSLRIFEVQSDASLEQYDFNDHTFKTTALTTATASMTHRTTDNSTYSTGLWTYALTTLTGFTSGGVYIYSVTNTSATPPTIEREIQFGGAEGDLLVTTGGFIQGDVIKIDGSTTAGTNLSNAYEAFETGTAQSGGTDTIVLRSGASSDNDYYKDQAVFIMSGAGAGQTNRITGYTGSSRTATCETDWITQPDNTSVYLVVGRIG